MKKIFLMACLASLFASCDSAPKVDNSTVSSVDLNRYLGSWYEIARYDHSFERGLEYAMAKYTMRDDGKIDVLNTGIKDGRAKDAKGIAKTTGVPVCVSGRRQPKLLVDSLPHAAAGGLHQDAHSRRSRTPRL